VIYLQLFFEFFITGAFSIGGGLAALPFLYKMAERYPWFSADILPDMIAISESTPGPIGINMATYAGIHAAGIGGALIATLALALPAFLIIVIVSKPLHRIKEHRITKSVFYMLRPAVTGLIAYSCWEIVRITLVKFPAAGILDFFQWKSIAIFAAVFFLYRRFRLHPIVYIVACGILGVLFQL